MKLSVTISDALPPLAWLAMAEPGQNRVALTAGRGVEVGDGWWFEGVWAGDFGQAGFGQSDAVCGSGGRIEGNMVRFVPPTHSLEALYWTARQGRFWVSNSLAFLLEALGDAPDLAYARYSPLFDSIVYGLKWYRPTIPTQKGAVLRRVHDPLVMGREGSERQARAPLAPPFAAFAHYQAYLEARAHALVENGRALTRKSVFSPLTAISSGYDSPAVAQVARKAGCTRAFSFTTARESVGRGALDDSGIAIGRALGYEVAALDRQHYRSAAIGTGGEFFATGMPGEELLFAPFEELFAGALFFTGFHGDKAWDKANGSFHIPLLRGDSSGSSFTEFRLRVGFAHCPLPFLGALRQADLTRISNAPEMRPWSVGGAYDRPIARRLAEEAGVPRALFGQVKKAVSTPVHEGRQMSPAGEAAYRRFLASHGLDPRRPSLTAPLRALADQAWRRVFWRRKWILKRTGLDVLMLDRFMPTPLLNPGNLAAFQPWKRYFFAWGFAETRARYEAAR
ncbi:MAG: hypothetical protein ACOY99_13065 [Pseudomonadota bacterium]